jgi:predicted phage-related endonuclease
LLEGKVAKEVDKLIAEYEDITAKTKDLETSKKAVLAKLFELTTTGINETSNVVFNIVENKGRVSVAVSKLKDRAPELWEKVRQTMGVVSIGDDYKTVRGIKHKGTRA